MSKGNIKIPNPSGRHQESFAFVRIQDLSRKAASLPLGYPGPNLIFRDQHKEKSLEYHNIQRKCKGNHFNAIYNILHKRF